MLNEFDLPQDLLGGQSFSNAIVENPEEEKCGVCCGCGSTDTYYTGRGVYQDADASRGMPMIESDEVYCRRCGRSFWY